MTIEDQIREALALRAKGRLAEALDALSGSGGFSQDLYVLRGDLQLEMGEVQKALESYSTVVAFQNDNVYAHRHLAECLCRLKSWSAAADAYRKLLELDPLDYVRIGLGDCLLHLNRAEEALQCFDQCWSEGSRVQALFGKAVALQLLRRFDEAEAAYERLVALEPKSEEAFSNLVAMSVEASDPVRVFRYSRRLLELCPDSLVALQGLTMVAVERGDYDDAAIHFNRVLAHPGDSGLGHEGKAAEYRIDMETVQRLEDAWGSRR